MFAIGAMSYLSAPLWLGFLTIGTALWVADSTLLPSWHALPAAHPGPDRRLPQARAAPVRRHRHADAQRRG